MGWLRTTAEEKVFVTGRDERPWDRKIEMASDRATMKTWRVQYFEVCQDITLGMYQVDEVRIPGRIKSHPALDHILIKRMCSCRMYINRVLMQASHVCPILLAGHSSGLVCVHLIILIILFLIIFLHRPLDALQECLDCIPTT
jgi:hypothetical protein